LANIKYGPLAEEIAGTVGGVTFARSAYSKTCRGWRMKVNKRRPQQFVIRAANGEAANLWRTWLTPAQRLLWDAYAATCPFTNSLGEIYYLNGFNMYVRNQSLLRIYANSMDNTPPADVGFPSVPMPTWDLDKDTGLLQLTALTPAPPSATEIWLTVNPLLPCTRQFPQRRFLARKRYSYNPPTLPWSVYTFPNANGVAAEQITHIFWYFYDLELRISATKISSVLTS